MSAKMLNVKISSLVMIFALSQSVWAGKLDIDYIHTSPTKALLYSAIVPGGGHFLLANADIKYKQKGLFFLVLGIGSYIYLGSQIKNGTQLSIATTFLGVAGLRLFEFDLVTDDAEVERLKWLRENIKTADVPLNAAEKKVSLKDGSIIIAKSMVYEGEYVKVETTAGIFTIPLKEISRIE